MDKQQAIDELIKFKEETGMSKELVSEVKRYFKTNKNEVIYNITDDKTGYQVSRQEFWDNVTQADICKVFKKSKLDKLTQLSQELGLYDEEPEEFCTEDKLKEYTKIRKDAVAYKQKYNFEKNNFNRQLRDVCALEDLNEEIKESLAKLKPLELHDSNMVLNVSSKDIGVVVVSDTHFNELIDIGSNKYDFNIASKRLKKLADETINQLNGRVKKLVVIGLGDLLNSDRRQSEYLNMATNRGKAIVLAFDLLRKFINQLHSYFEITVAFVSGNESRVVGQEYDTSEEIATYNYDHTIFNMLQIAFENTNISFVGGDFGEKIININGSNVLLCHGIGVKQDIEKSVAQTFGRYANAGIILDYMLMGHLHSARIGDMYARCGSLCGGNSYSEGTLNLTSRASQLIGVFKPDKTNSFTRVDLQNTDGVDGYDINQDLITHNIKCVNSTDKLIIHNV